MVSTPPPRAITRESRETDETSCKAQGAKLVWPGPPLAALAGNLGRQGLGFRGLGFRA